MIDASVARRYARALFSLGLEEKGAVERYGAELVAVSGALEGSPELRTALLLPGLTPAQRQGAVTAIAQKANLSAGMARFLALLVDRARLDGVGLISEAYGELLDAHLGRVRATVTAAQPLGAEELGKLQQALATATKKQVILDSKSDPQLLGGVVAEVGGVVYDGSLRTQLERLREQLKAAPL